MICVDSFELTDVKTFILVCDGNLFLFKKYDEDFKLILKTKAYCGINGFTENKAEGDGKTPVGVFTVGNAMGFKKHINTKLNYIRLSKYHYYVDDPGSRCYNRLVNIKNVIPDWSNAEQMKKFKRQYYCAIDIGYNKANEKGRGSCILLHCKGNKDHTAGCIAISKKDMLFCLENIDENTKIIIKNTA